MSNQIAAPFSDDQVASLNAYQASDSFHPFTCGSLECREVLQADSDGWSCAKCSYRQDWAHEFMADWSWKPLTE